MRRRLGIVQRRNGMRFGSILRGGRCGWFLAPNRPGSGTANRLAVAASRMVGAKRANGIYSSPFVKTMWIKACNEKAGSAEHVPELLSTQALIRKGAAEGS